MYKTSAQMSISDFVFPYGNLDPNNRWVKLSARIPWDEVDRTYAEKFVQNGAPAHPSRMALGALIAKQMLKVSDESLVWLVAENPYLQYFIGLKSFQKNCPFGASTMVAFRKRFSFEDIAQINEWTLSDTPVGDESDDDSADLSDNDNDNSGGGRRVSGTAASGNKGTVALDATVAPSDITYPTDVGLLNEARVKLEALIDDLCAQTGAKRPRTYREVARRDFLCWSKLKKKSYKKTRQAQRKQLSYVERDLGYVFELVSCGVDLTDRQEDLFKTIVALYGQQRHMYDTKTNSVPDRIVSITQPWVRPIVRGKQKAKTEFGAKIHVSVVDGYARIETLSFDAYNEAEDFKRALRAYRKRYGYWPEAVLVDKLYRNRANRAFSKKLGIRMSGPPLGRPPKDVTVTAVQKRQEYLDSCDRNTIEGVFGTTKTAYGLDPVKARLEDTSKTVIALAILVFNLKKLLASSLFHFSDRILKSLSELLLEKRGVGVIFKLPVSDYCW